MPRSTLFRHLILALQAARRENQEASGQPPASNQPSAGWTRRRWLQAMAAASASAATVPSPASPLRWARPSGAPRVAIIGAGIAGLHAAWRLKKAGIRATVYEAQHRVGGRMLSVRDAVGAGLTIDLGAELINTDHQDMLDLARAFGIELFDRKADTGNLPFPATAIFVDGKLRGEAELANDLRALAAQIAKDSALLDADFATWGPRLDRLSVEDYLERHAGLIPRPYIRTLVTLAIRTEFGVEPCESSALQLIGLLPIVDGNSVDLLSYSDETYAVVGGSQTITDALAAGLDGQIQLGRRLSALTRYGDSHWLYFGDGSVAEADFVILTTPFSALRSVALYLPLPGNLRRFIQELELGRNEKLIAGFNQRFWRTGRIFGSEALTDLGFAEVWDESQRQPELTAGALNFFLGGSEVDDSRNVPLRPLGRTFIERLDRFAPGAIATANGRFARSRWTRGRYSQGAYANFKPGQLTRFADLFWIEADDPAERQEVAVGSLVFAGEHLSDAYYGFMNGGAQTGRLAADWVLRAINPG